MKGKGKRKSLLYQIRIIKEMLCQRWVQSGSRRKETQDGGRAFQAGPFPHPGRLNTGNRLIRSEICRTGLLSAGKGLSVRRIPRRSDSSRPMPVLRKRFPLKGPGRPAAGIRRQGRRMGNRPARGLLRVVFPEIGRLTRKTPARGLVFFKECIPALPAPYRRR